LELPFAPIDLWIEFVQEGVAKNHSVLSQGRQEEPLKLLFPIIENPEPTIVSDFASSVFCAIDIVHCDGLIKFLSPDS